MKDEYVIINKTKVLKKIEGLKSDYSRLSKNNDNQWCSIIAGKISELELMLNNSTPLESILSDALTNGINIASLSSIILGGNEEYSAEVKYDEKDIIFYKTEYINNLKLDI